MHFPLHQFFDSNKPNTSKKLKLKCEDQLRPTPKGKTQKKNKNETAFHIMWNMLQ
jgi:hypothetical protein